MSDNKISLDFESLLRASSKFIDLKEELLTATRTSVTGMCNLVVSYEDPAMVDAFLRFCYSPHQLYRETYDIDAVELQQGSPGSGYAKDYLDYLIFGNIQSDGGGPQKDKKTGRRIRKADGFVNRRELKNPDTQDINLIIKNFDYSYDFCMEGPGKVSLRSMWLFDQFRHPNIKKRCKIIFVTNEKLELPFEISTVQMPPVDTTEAEHIFHSVQDVLRQKGIQPSFTDVQLNQIFRKLCGLTYTNATDAFISAVSKSVLKEGDEYIGLNTQAVLKNLRKKINGSFMEKAFGLSHLESRPWEDYICSASSSFSYDVKKITRDFDEISVLKKEETIESEETIEAIRTRIPHVIILYGKGGVGKSAFPIHFAGLLDFDVWDFNVNVTHSMWVSKGAEQMRGSLDQIMKASHVVVRIDEYDRAIGATGASGKGMHSAHKQVESEFMNWLQNAQEDNLFVKKDIFIILTTNHKENITGPLLRTGRADLVIDIGDFDAQSMKETFLTASRRMQHRGIMLVGFGKDYRKLQSAIESLDLDEIAKIAKEKNFVVRDVDTLIMEMAAHNYYHQKDQSGLPWNTSSFSEVLIKSKGSGSSEDTCELVLGDRFITYFGLIMNWLMVQTLKFDIVRFC